MIPHIGPEIVNALLRRENSPSCPPESSPHSPHSDISDESDSVPSRSVKKKPSFFNKLFTMARRSTTTRAVALALCVLSR
jgi:hypothetical protein